MEAVLEPAPIESRKRPRSASFAETKPAPRIVMVEVCATDEIEDTNTVSVESDPLYTRQHPRVFGSQMLTSLQSPIEGEDPPLTMELILQKPPHVRNVSDDELVRYTLAAVVAIRNNNVQQLRDLWLQSLSSGDDHALSWLDGRNRNGESLLHLACRRSTVQVVRFLIHEAKVNVTVADLHGRTCFHDICWRPRVEEAIPIFTLLYQHFLAQPPSEDRWWPFHPDTRGHCCFDYCRQEHWKEWNSYLHNSWLAE